METSDINLLLSKNVILEGPPYHVTEGDPLNLRCRFRDQPSNLSADFYKDGTLLQTSTTGEMTIPAVSKSHEGYYKCRNPERGDSPESLVTVKASSSESANQIKEDVVIALVIILAMARILLWLYCFKKARGHIMDASVLGQQHQNSGENSRRSHIAGSRGAQSDYETMDRVVDTTHAYASIKIERAPQQKIVDTTHTYANIDVASASQQKNNDCIYEVMAPQHKVKTREVKSD